MFSIGDVVRLKSGSPAMTIYREIDSDNEYYCMYWSSQTQTLEGISLKEEVLIYANPDSFEK